MPRPVVEPPFVAPPGSQLIEMPEYSLYLPAHFDAMTKHALIIAMSPDADAQSMLRVWQRSAEKHDWIIYASKTVRDGVAYDQMLPSLVKNVAKLETEYPIDPQRIIAAGFSGGAMTAHFLSKAAPGLIAGLVLNTGMMPEYQTPDGAVKTQSEIDAPYPRSKIAVFLASPKDFRYAEMKRDRAYLESLQWKITWIEFGEGHALAPAATYEAAGDWLASVWAAQ